MRTLKFLVALLCCILINQNVKSQDTLVRTSGISATLQTTQLGVMVPFWITRKISFSPALDIRWGEKLATDFALGIVPRFYFSTEKLSPYIGLKAAVDFYLPADNNSTETKTTDYMAGLAFGGEYFFDPRFSVGVEMQANFTKSDKNSMRFGNPGNWNFNLGTMVTANIYFVKKR